jgi:transposase
MEIDGRTLDHASLETIRRMAVRRVHEGESPSAVIRSYGLCRTTIYKWLRAVRKGGERALRSRKATGRPPTLTAREKEKVRRWINGRNPRQYGFDFGLWTRQIVAELLRERMGIRLGVTAIGRLLYELNITPQKPLRRAYERDPQSIERWKREAYPALRNRAKQRGAKIFFADETGIRSDAAPGKTWGMRGQTPVVETSGRRQSVNAISAVTPRGEFWYRTYRGTLNAQTFLGFLRAFLHGRRKPVFLVVDSHPAHVAKAVAQYVQSLRGRLELHFLPGYAPEFNPDEFVWNHLKTHAIRKRPLRRDEDLRDRVEAELRAIQAWPSLLRSFFRAPIVAYITD